MFQHHFVPVIYSLVFAVIEELEPVRSCCPAWQGLVYHHDVHDNCNFLS